MNICLLLNPVFDTSTKMTGLTGSRHSIFLCITGLSQKNTRSLVAYPSSPSIVQIRAIQIIGFMLPFVTPEPHLALTTTQSLFSRVGGGSLQLLFVVATSFVSSSLLCTEKPSCLFPTSNGQAVTQVRHSSQKQVLKSISVLTFRLIRQYDMHKNYDFRMTFSGVGKVM